jgi:hypothetical protein
MIKSETCEQQNDGKRELCDTHCKRQNQHAEEMSAEDGIETTRMVPLLNVHAEERKQSHMMKPSKEMTMRPQLVAE